MESNYQTPQRTPRSRRKALSPQTTSVYSSPYQVLELTPGADIEDMKTTLVQQDGMIQELRGTVEELQTKMTENIDDSIIIETTQKISMHDRKISERDAAMYQKELESQKELVRSVRKERDEEARTRRSVAMKLREAENKAADMECQVEHLETRTIDLEAKIAEQIEKMEDDGREIRRLQDDLTAANSQKKIYEEKIKKEKQTVKELNRKLENLTKSYEDCKKRELELRVQLDSQNQARQIVEETLTKLRDESSSNTVLREIETNLTQLIKIPQNKLSDMSSAEQIGALKNKIEYKDREILELQEREQDLLNRLERVRTKSTTEEEEVRTLKHELLKSTDRKILETDKLKEQKAEIRCQLIQQRKENQKLLEKIMQMESSSPFSSEVQTLKIENTLLSEKLEAYKKSVEELEEKLKKKQEEYEIAVANKDEKALLKQQRDKSETSNAELRKYLVFLDEQCETYRDKKNRAEAAVKRHLEEIQELREKFKDSEKQSEGVRASEAELSQLRVENERLENKITYLKEELNECHSDYREELARMAREVSESKRKARDANEQADHSILIADLKKQLSQQESTQRSTKRQIDELKQDNIKLQGQVSEVLEREKKTVEENTRLRQGLTESITKLEQYRGDLDDQKEMNQSLAEKVGGYEEKLTKLKDEVMELEDTLDEKSRLIIYLQSQINVKQLPKVSRRSTLLKTISDVSLSSSTVESVNMEELENYGEEVKELENLKQQMRKELNEKKQIIHERRNTPPTLQPFKVPAASIKEIQNVPERAVQPRMKHDIPHKWKDLRNLGIFSIKCAVCFIGVPTLHKARRCNHCGVVVHYYCSHKVVNTCGLPDEYATYYRETHTVPVGRMNGWIRIFRDDTDSKNWESCWALMDDRSISFYDKEAVNSNLQNPFLKIDLASENFLVRAGTAAPQNADQSTQVHTSIIQLKLSKYSIFILAPSNQSAKRWTEALNAAHSRRMMLTRKPSSFSEQTCILSLNTPNNLTVHTTAVIDDCLLIGAKAGLFFTHLSSPRMPIRFCGVDSVICMEIMPDINTIALITGQHKNLSILPLSTLKNQLNSPQPTVQLDCISNLSHLHLLAYHQQDGQRYLFVADTVKLFCLKYNSHRDVFVLFHTIETHEPAMCLQSTPSGFFFGSDSFYRVELNSNTPTAVPLAAAHVADYPIAVLNVGVNELLLAYQNYGLFVDPQGNRTREQVVEWEQMPMEFIYTAPFLYVIHYDTIEIMQIAQNLGLNSKTILDEREVFTCQNAHIVGTRTNGDIFVSISSKEATELHKFNATQQRRTTMKRRGISLSHFANSSAKMSKN